MFKVLVVDDSKLAKKRVIDLLEQASIKCEVISTANDGLEGLDAYFKYKPNLVITDIEMPNMDGKEFIGKLKKLDNALPIITITSLVNEKIRQNLLKNKNVYILYKPINNKILNILLNKLSNKIFKTKENS